jgi:tryptophanase
MPQLVHKKGMYFISNIHFDTTRAHVEHAGARAIDCVIDACFDLDTYHPFKGNFDTEKLRRDYTRKRCKENIAGIIMTITNNSAGGQPVSMENLKSCFKNC